MKISAVINGHREGILAGPSIASFRAAVLIAERQGLQVETIAVLDRPDELTRRMFEIEADRWDRIVVTDHGDPGLARNRGVTEGTGDYVTFLDADDLWSANWIVAAFAMADRLRDASILHSEANLVFGAEKLLWVHVDSTEPGFDPGYLWLSNYWDALAFCRRDIYAQHPFRQNDLTAGYGHEDWHWNMVTLAAGSDHRPVPDTIHFKRRRRGSQMGAANAKDGVPWPLSPEQVRAIRARIPILSAAP